MNREAWIRTFAQELLPAAHAEGLIDGVDIYIEDIAFSVADLEMLADAAHRAGLPMRCHADQLGPSGAAEAMAALGGRSADHLNNLSAAGLRALSERPTAAVLLPASTLILGAGAPPARGLIDAGAAVALATDFNPGTSPVLSMPEVIALGCALYGLTPEEAFVAATANPAWVLGWEGLRGTLEPGSRADFLVLDCDGISAIAYRPGHNPVEQTWIGGARVWG
jgi:imidazolonepropionase